MDGVSVLVGAVGGALGGNIGGTLLRKYSLGTAGNSIVGAIGGGIASWVLGAVDAASRVARAATALSGGFDIGTVLGTVAGGVIGGIVLMTIAGFIWKSISARGR